MIVKEFSRNWRGTSSNTEGKSREWPNILLPVHLLFLSSCVTLPTYQPVQLPAYALSYFSECRKQDGAVTFLFNGNSQQSEKVDAEWASKSNGDWALASYSPLGQTLFQASYVQSASSIKVTGRQNPWFNSIGVGEDGFLRWKGQRLGLKAVEIACLLEMKLPRAWLKQVIDQGPAKQQEMRLTVADRTRRVEVLVGRYGGEQSWIWQAHVNWDLYWGLRQESLNFRLNKEAGLEFGSENYPDLGWRMVKRED